MAASLSSHSSNSQPLTTLQLQQLQIFPQCLEIVKEFHSKIEACRKKSTSAPIYPLHSQLLSRAIVKKINKAFLNKKVREYHSALQEHFIFNLCARLHKSLVGKNLIGDNFSELYGEKYHINCTILHPSSFENSLFVALPQSIKEIMKKTLLVEYKNAFTIQNFIDIFKKEISLGENFIGRSLEADIKYKRFAIENNEINFPKHSTKLTMSPDKFNEEMECAKKMVLGLPIGEIKQIENHNAVVSKVVKQDRICSYIYFWNGKPSDMSTHGSEIAVGIKASTGKEIVIKKEKVGKVVCLNVFIEARLLREILDKAESRGAELFQSYPEAFEVTQKGRKVIVFQSRPYTFANPSIMITDKCDTSAKDYNLEYDARVQELCSRLMNLDVQALIKMREFAVTMNALQKNCETQLIGREQYDLEAAKVQEEINKLNLALSASYHQVMESKKDFDANVMRERQQSFLRLGLFLVAGLAVLHKISYIHGDMKKENIFIDKVKTLLPKPVIGDWRTALFLRNAVIEPKISKEERIEVLNGCTESSISESCFNELVNSLLSEERSRVNRAAKSFDCFGLGSILYTLLVGVKLPYQYTLTKNSQNVYKVCVKPQSCAFDDPVFLLLPQPVQDVLKRMINSDPTFDIHEAYLAFKCPVTQPEPEEIKTT